MIVFYYKLLIERLSIDYDFQNQLKSQSHSIWLREFQSITIDYNWLLIVESDLHDLKSKCTAYKNTNCF